MEGWLVRLLRNRFQWDLETSIEHGAGALKVEIEKKDIKRLIEIQNIKIMPPVNLQLYRSGELFQEFKKLY